jgi:hypothetical protein
MAKRHSSMKKAFCLILFCLSLILSNKASGQDSEIVAYNSHFKNELKGWTKSFNNFNLDSFGKAETFSFENIPFMNINDTSSFYPIYKPALTFSNDKKEFIDIYSYWLNLEREGKTIISFGGEADQAISLCNLKTKTWVRIFFRGTTERIQDVTWVSNSKFILVGVSENEMGIQNPIIYLGNTITKEFICFTPRDKTLIQNTGYTSPKLLRLKIQER